MTCLQCGDVAFTHAEWKVGEQPQEADLCKRCTDEMWKMFGRTTLFHFSEPEAE